MERKGKSTPESYQSARLLNRSCKRLSCRKPGADPEPCHSDKQLLWRNSTGFTASPQAAGASRDPKGRLEWLGTSQGNLAAKTHHTCQWRVSPKEWLYSPCCTKLMNERPRVLKPPSHHVCHCQVNGVGHRTTVFTLLSHLLHTGGCAALPCLPACLATAGSCSLAGKPQPAGQPWVVATEASHS